MADEKILKDESLKDEPLKDELLSDEELDKVAGGNLPLSLGGNPNTDTASNQPSAAKAVNWLK